MLWAGAKIQILDLPGIIEGAKDGKGRGKQVIGTARTCNVICVVLDATRCVCVCVRACVCVCVCVCCVLCVCVYVRVSCIVPAALTVTLPARRPLTHKKIIEAELEGFGIRMNKKPPNIAFRKKEKGGISFRSSCM